MVEASVRAALWLGWFALVACAKPNYVNPITSSVKPIALGEECALILLIMA